MPSNTQTILPTQFPLSMPPLHSYTVMQFRSTQNDDEDDICPVCESDCTCGNTNIQSSTPQPLTSVPAPLPLKIKLPPLRTPISAPKSTSVRRTRPKSIKPKQMTAGSETADGTNNNSNHRLLHRPSPFSVPGHQLGDPLPVATTPDLLRGTSPLTPEPELEPPSKARGKPKQLGKASTPKNRKKAVTTPSKAKSTHKTLPVKKTTAAGLRSRKPEVTTWTTSSNRKGKAAFQPTLDKSDGNLHGDDDPFVSRTSLDSDAESVHFPTFVSAISTSGNDNDSASVTSDSFDSDCSVRAEEEDLILVEERAKLRREIFNSEDSWHMEKRKWDHLKNNNNWEIRPRKKSVGAGETESEDETDSDSDSESQEEEDEGGEADDDDPDIRYGRGMVTGWQSSDDDFDAELFFATLTDSSGPGSDADAEDGEESRDSQSDGNSDLSEISLTEAAAAGLLSYPYGDNGSLVVTEDWDGRLVFANGLKDGQGVLDVHFEVSTARRHRGIREALGVSLDGNEVLEDEDNEEDIISDDGETTDDMLDHHPAMSTPQGIVPLPFRCPTPPVTSIDPLSTLSPNIGSRHNKLFKEAVAMQSLKPADILASAKKNIRENSHVPDNNDEHSASVSVASPPETAASSPRSRLPSMGSFKNMCMDPKRSAIIDGSKRVVFSPFSHNRRVRKSLARGRKRTATGNDIFPYPSKRIRQTSLPDSHRALLVADAEEFSSPLVQSSPELPIPAAPIDLDDVLNVSFLDSDDTNEAATNTSGERHIRNLTRWDRVPMATFRRRTAHLDENSVRVDSLAPPNDGVSYGSAGGHALRKSPLGAALWQNNNSKTSIQPPGTIPVSPVIFPQRDDDCIPTYQYQDFLQKPLPGEAGPSKSRKQKRKEKKRIAPASNNISGRGSYHVPALVSPFEL